MPATSSTYQLMSLNARWPGFASTQREARPWPGRCAQLARAIRASRVGLVSAQELGQAEASDLAGNLGPRWRYQRAGLNAVLWRDDWRIDDPGRDQQSRDWQLRSHGQYLRTLIACRLRHTKSGQYVFVASTHLAAAASDLTPEQAVLARRDQAHQVADILHGYRQVILAADLNSRHGLGDPRDILERDGWSFSDPPFLQNDPHRGIDAIGTKRRVTVLTVQLVQLGSASDHAARIATFTITDGSPKA